MTSAKTLQRVIESGLVQAAIIVTFLVPRYAVAEGPQEGRASQSAKSDPYVILLENQVALAKQNEQLRQQLDQMQLMLKGMLELQAKSQLPKDVREQTAQAEQKRADDANTQLKDAKTDFGSEEGRKLREQLSADAEFIKSKPINTSTSKQDVDAVIGRIQDAQDRIRHRYRQFPARTHGRTWRTWLSSWDISLREGSDRLSTRLANC